MRLSAWLAAALLPATCMALLRERSLSHFSDVVSWPRWYSDSNGLTLTLCTSPAPSVNALGTFCAPTTPDPAAFAGNIGPEAFYYKVGRPTVMCRVLSHHGSHVVRHSADW